MENDSTGQEPLNPAQSESAFAEASADERAASQFPFDPVPRGGRHDGWTPDKQIAFIDALGECGCVTEACQRVGMSPSSAYRLRREFQSLAFRDAWDAALDHAISRLSDAAFSRALNGVSRPVYFQGELVGERRYYDERLTMFLLRYRDPLRYAKSLDKMTYERRPDNPPALRLFLATQMAEDEAWKDYDPPNDEEDEEKGTCRDFREL